MQSPLNLPTLDASIDFRDGALPMMCGEPDVGETETAPQMAVSVYRVIGLVFVSGSSFLNPSTRLGQAHTYCIVKDPDEWSPYRCYRSRSVDYRSICDERGFKMTMTAIGATSLYFCPSVCLSQDLDSAFFERETSRRTWRAGGLVQRLDNRNDSVTVNSLHGLLV